MKNANLQDLDVLQQTRDPALQASKQYASASAQKSADRLYKSQGDALGVGSLLLTQLQDADFYTGKIRVSLPYLHYYLVQLNDSTVVPAVYASKATNIGAKQATVLPPATNVVVYRSKDVGPYIILSSFPDSFSQDKYSFPQILQQGGNTNFRKQPAYRSFNTMFEDFGNITNNGNNKPMDGSVFEESITTETGVSFLIDPFQAAISVSEVCGLFLNWFDNYARLTGEQLDIDSFSEHLRQRYDEGENVYIRGNLVYPWESLGSYDPGSFSTASTTVEAKDYQTDKEKPYGYYDLEEEHLDTAPIYRYTEYGGHLGQGHTRMLMKPAKDTGVRRYGTFDGPDYGLWQESVALDGAYTLRSAKSVYIGKYLLIPVPKRQKLCEDQKDGDDAREDNYKFSGEYGGGDEHKVGDVKVEGDSPNLLKVAGVLDLLAYNYNWKNTHPFYYHKKDYKFPEESELVDLEKAQASLDYRRDSNVDQPNPKRLNIDSRYNDVEYFQTMSGINFLDDGSVVLSDGYGTQLTMSAGRLSLEAPNDIVIQAGGRVVSLSDEMFIRAKSNVEISSSEKDVRFKAERNMQLLSGNGGKGGTLIENRSTSVSHNFKGKDGDEIRDSGITLLTKSSDVGLLSRNTYIRSGAGTKKGTITLDCAQGEKNLVTYSKSTNMFNSKGVNIWHAPSGKDGGAFVASHRFAEKTSLHASHLFVKRWLGAMDGGVVAAKTILSKKNIIAIKKMAQKGGGFVGDSSKAEGKVDSFLGKIAEALEKHRLSGETVFQNTLTKQYYDKPTQLGNEELINDTMGFSFNDRRTDYGYDLSDGWKLTEPRWQQYVRFDMATGGSEWTENPVTYQGAQLYPFPGKKAWTEDDSFQQLEELKIFDTETSTSKDRPYDEPELSKLTGIPADGNYKLLSK